MTNLSLHGLALIAALALLTLSSTPATVNAAPILSPRFMHAATSDLAPGSAFFASPSSQSAVMRRRSSRSNLHRRSSHSKHQGRRNGASTSSKVDTSSSTILGLGTNAEAQARAKVGASSHSQKD